MNSPYDWTGTTLQVRTLLQNGMNDPNNQYDDIWFGGYGDIFAPSSPFPNAPFASMEAKNVGPSTYKWLWTPPNKPNTQTPDLVNFPVPANLFMAAGEELQASVQPCDPQGLPAGLGGTATVTDDFGASQTKGYNQVASLLSYGIVLGKTDTANPQLRDGLVAATTYAKGTMTTVANQADTTTCQTLINAHAVSAVELTLPDPFYYPQVSPPDSPDVPLVPGAAKNQYAYDSSGYLKIEAAIGVKNFTLAQMTPLIPWLYWSHNIPSSVVGQTQRIANTAKASAGKLVPHPTQGNGLADGFLWLYGLPNLNSDFGNHTVTLSAHVGGSKFSEVAHIQTFFPPNDQTHYLPQGYTPTPNWFWYYSQVDNTKTDNGNPVQYNPDAMSHPGTLGYTNYTNIYVLPGANGSRQQIVFRVVNVNGTRLVRQYGYVDLKGLYAYIQLIGHERGHITDHNAGEEGGTPDGDEGSGDGLLDAWELRNNFNPNIKDTSGAYSNLPMNSPDFGKGDRECLADIQGLGYLISANAQKAWKQDWAVGGLQWGPVDVSGNTTPYFPFGFTPVDPVTGVAGPEAKMLPSDVLTSSTQLDGHGL